MMALNSSRWAIRSFRLAIGFIVASAMFFTGASFAPAYAQDSTIASPTKLPDYVKIYPNGIVNLVKVGPTSTTIRFTVSVPISEIIDFYRQAAAQDQASLTFDSGDAPNFRAVTFGKKEHHFSFRVFATRKDNVTTVSVNYISSK